MLSKSHFDTKQTHHLILIVSSAMYTLEEKTQSRARVGFSLEGQQRLSHKGTVYPRQGSNDLGMRRARRKALLVDRMQKTWMQSSRSHKETDEQALQMDRDRAHGKAQEGTAACVLQLFGAGEDPVIPEPGLEE